MDAWQDPLVTLRLPKIINLRTDPFEIAPHEAGEYDKWRVERTFLLVPAQAFGVQHLATYQEYPPRQKPGSFALDEVLAKLQEGTKQ